MAPTLYFVYFSPPVRAVLMTAKHLGIEFNLKELDIQSGEHKTPEYLKINPQHTVPTLVDDDGFVIWESHAIMPYLISKYGKDDSLYPKDIKKRAVIDQRLFFEAGIVFAHILKIVRSLRVKGKKTIDQEDKDYTQEIYQFIEEFLNGRKWIAGDFVSIADYSLISSITSLDVFIPIDSSKYSKLHAWLKRAEILPAYEQNKIGLEVMKGWIKSFLD